MINVISNCSFLSNIAGSSGGAVWLNNPNNLIISDCTFSNNTATKGGSIYYQENCKFFYHIFVKIKLFLANIAHFEIISNKLSYNSATENGAAFYISDSYGVTFLSNSTINDNFLISSQQNLLGSIFYCSNPGNFTILNSIFFNNTGIFGACLHYQEQSNFNLQYRTYNNIITIRIWIFYKLNHE